MKSKSLSDVARAATAVQSSDERHEMIFLPPRNYELPTGFNGE